MQTTLIRACLIVLLATGPVWSQIDAGASPAAEESMVTPSPVNVEGPSLAFASEREHMNFLRGGLLFSPVYDDGLLFSDRPADVSYSIRPWIAIDESGARLHANIYYSPGFTFYQRNSSLNQSDHDLTAEFQYRLSPHVTLTLRDALTKSSGFSYHLNPNSIGSESGVLQSPNQSVIAPPADTLFNNANGQITCQFSANGMIGATGTDTEQQYLQPSQVDGLSNWSTRAGTVFYTYRLSRRHYLGATYQFQQLLSHSQPSGAETKTHGVFLFYTLYLSPMLSLSFFGGPQHSEFTGLLMPANVGWSPAGGGDLAWQGHHTSARLGVTHRVTDGSGLQSAAISTSADLSIRHQLSKTLTLVIGGDYTHNSFVDPVPGSAGHTLLGSFSLQRTLGEHFSVEAGYTRVHQSYSNIPSITTIPNRNHALVAFSYNFERPLGR